RSYLVHSAGLRMLSCDGCGGFDQPHNRLGGKAIRTWPAMSAGLLYLASASPRRRDLLDQIGVTCLVRPVDIDEARQPEEAARDYVLRLARDKAETAWSRFAASEGSPVLAADTAVVLDGEIFGKPRDQTEGTAMLDRLSGRTHEVLTAVALRTRAGLDAR